MTEKRETCGHLSAVPGSERACKMLGGEHDCPPGADDECTVPAGGGDRSGVCGDCCGRDERCSLDPDNECMIIEHQQDELVWLRDQLASERARAEKAEIKVAALEAEVAEKETRWVELRYWAGGPHVAKRGNCIVNTLTDTALLAKLDRLSTPADVVRVVVAYDDCGTEQLEFEEPTGVEYRKDDVLYLVRRKP